MIIGLMGSGNLKDLLAGVVGETYKFVDMEPKKNFKFLRAITLHKCFSLYI